MKWREYQKINAQCSQIGKKRVKKLLLTALRARGDLLPEKISRGEVGEAVLGHDLVALGALATKKE